MDDTQNAPHREDDFDGDDTHLVDSINALLSLDDAHALVPNGLGGPSSHAYRLLAAASARLSAPLSMNECRLYNTLSTAVCTIEGNRREIAALTPKAEAYERLGQVLDLAYDRGSTRGGLAGVDPVYELRREIEQIEQRMRGEKQTAARQAQRVYDPTEHPPGTAGIDRAGAVTLGGQEFDRVTLGKRPIVPGTYTGHAGSNGGSD